MGVLVSKLTKEEPCLNSLPPSLYPLYTLSIPTLYSAYLYAIPFMFSPCFLIHVQRPFSCI